MIADDGASPACGQGVQAPRRQPATLSIPVAFSPDPGENGGERHETGIEQDHAQEQAPAPQPQPPAAAPAPAGQQPRPTARHRAAPKHTLPRRIAALWTRARDAS